MIIKSDGNIRCYHNLPEATTETIRDRWIYTGDCGWIDPEGYVFIVDRKKDMIVSGALNIYPAEIENVLYEHPDVLECAVIGIPDETWGEAVRAIVVVKQGRQLTAEDLIEFCREKIAPFKRPRSVEFVEKLPRNVSGKILKRTLREALWQGYTRRV
jgi:fatty-acyl-CoA synthase